MHPVLFSFPFPHFQSAFWYLPLFAAILYGGQWAQTLWWMVFPPPPETPTSSAPPGVNGGSGESNDDSPATGGKKGKGKNKGVKAVPLSETPRTETPPEATLPAPPWWIMVLGMAAGFALFMLLATVLGIAWTWQDRPLRSYGVMLGLSFVLGWAWLRFVAVARGLHPDNYAMPILAAAVFALLGSRFFHHLSNGEWHKFFNFLGDEGGLVAIGGYVFGVGAGAIVLYRQGVDVWRHLDAATPMLALGLGLTRIGCFLNGCCFGVPTDGPFGVRFPNGSAAFWQLLEQGHVHRHDAATPPLLATQLLESGLGFLLVAVTYVYLFRDKLLGMQAPLRGAVFLLFVALYSTGRFILEMWRADEERAMYFGLLSESQLYGLLLIGFAIATALYLRKHPKYVFPQRYFDHMKAMGLPPGSPNPW